MNDKEKALRFLAKSLDVDLDNKGVAVTTEEIGACAETHDGKLSAMVFPNGAGYAKIQGLRLPGIRIEIIDRNDPKNEAYPKGAAYKLRTYFKGEYDESIPGSIFIDENGKFLAHDRCVEII